LVGEFFPFLFRVFSTGYMSAVPDVFNGIIELPKPSFSGELRLSGLEAPRVTALMLKESLMDYEGEVAYFGL
jgi:hypothetical protein